MGKKTEKRSDSVSKREQTRGEKRPESIGRKEVNTRNDKRSESVSKKDPP